MNTFNLPANIHEAWMAAGWAWVDSAAQQARPSVLFKPRLTMDGNQWSALYGDNVMDGCAGFGDTPEKAMAAFDKEWASASPAEPAF